MMYVFWVILLLYGLVEAVTGMGQGMEYLVRHGDFSGGFPVVTGTMHHPAPFSIILAVILPIAVFNIMNRFVSGRPSSRWTGRALNILSWIYILPALFSISLSMCRTAWIASCVGCAVVALVVLRRYGRISERMVLKLSVACFCVMALVAIPLYCMKQDSADGRVLIWKVSVTALSDNPLKGAGHGRFGGAYGDAQEEYFRSGAGTDRERILAGSPDFAYNEFLHMAVEHGLIVLCIFFAVIVYSFHNLGKSAAEESMAVTGALAGLMTAFMFSYPLHVFQSCLISAVVIILAVMFPGQKSGFRYMLDVTVAGSLIVISGLAICKSYDRTGNGREAVRQWKMLQGYYGEDKYSEMCDLYGTLYPYLDSCPEFLFEYGQCLSGTGRYSESNTVLEKGAERSADPMFYNIIGKNHMSMGNYDLAEDAFWKAYYRVPHRIYPLYLLMRLYGERGWTVEQEAMARRIVSAEEKVESEEGAWLKEAAWKCLKSINDEKYHEACH